MNGIVNVRTAYPTSKPYAKISFLALFLTIQTENDYLTDTLGNIIGKTKKTKINKQWWKQDSITLPGRNI
jgi:hypothetical protein